MTLRPPLVKPESSAELAEKTSHSVKRMSGANTVEVCHQETQPGPISKLKREIAQPAVSAERSVRAVESLCGKVQQEEHFYDFYHEDEAQEKCGSNTRSKQKMVLKNEEKDLTFGCDTLARLDAISRRLDALYMQ